MPTELAGERFYTLKEVADGLGVHYQTVKAWVSNGTMNAAKVGRSYRVTEAELRRLTAAHKGEATST